MTMAKTCLLCGETAADDVVTCPNDGEASWSDATSRATEEASGAAGADDAPKPKRGRK